MKASLVPSLNGLANQTYNYGRTIDPSTNQFANQHNRTNYLSLSSDVIIFNGLQKQNDIRQAEWTKKAAAYDLQKIKDDISLSVANAYLQVLLLKERETQLRQQIATSTSNKQKTDNLFIAGSVNLQKTYEADAQVASDKAALVDIQNQLSKANLQLKQYMNVDVEKSVWIKSINIESVTQHYTETDRDNAIKDRIPQLPAYLRANSLVQSAIYGLNASRSNMSPKLSASGSLHTIYSSAARNYSYEINGIQVIGATADSNLVYAPKYLTTLSPITFKDQLHNNFGESFGFSLSVPIFNGLQNKFAIQSAKIALKGYQIGRTEAEVQLKNDIYNAYSSLQMAKNKYDAALLKLKSQELLNKQTDIGYTQGTVSYFEWSSIRNTFSIAQSEALQAKYEYVFQQKVFEYYLGKPIQF